MGWSSAATVATVPCRWEFIARSLSVFTTNWRGDSWLFSFQQHVQLPGKTLKENEQEEHICVLTTGAKLQHLSKKFSGLAATKDSLQEISILSKLVHGQQLLLEGGA
jgi:hypothetical protein